jgi:ferritin
MKLSENLNDSLNFQILLEFGNAMKYNQISSYFEDLQLSHLSSFFKKQSDGENDHAHLFIDHINSRNGGSVILGEIDAPKSDFTDIASIADFYVTTEQQTTESIESLYDMALMEKSYIDLPFLSKLLDEQVEEEDTSQKLAMNLKMCKDIVLFDSTFEG